MKPELCNATPAVNLSFMPSMCSRLLSIWSAVHLIHFRRSTTCNTDCGNGRVPKTGSDDCALAQDFCTPEQCGKCAACLKQATYPLHKCYRKLKEEQKDIAPQCLDLNSVWCSELQYHFMQCEKTSWPCYLHLLCHSPCICPSWKSVRCGGYTTDEGECNEAHVVSLLQLGSGQEEQASGNASAADKHDLSKMTQSFLHERAMEIGVDKDSVYNAADAADPKAALIKLIMDKQASTDGLNDMKTSELYRHADKLGIDAKAVLEADGTDNPKAALIKLIRQKQESHSLSERRTETFGRNIEGLDQGLDGSMLGKCSTTK